MWTRDQNILSREFSQQLISRRRSRNLVDVEDRRNLGMRQLDAVITENVVCLPTPSAAGTDRG